MFFDNSEKEQNETSRKSISDEELSDNGKKHEVDAEKGLTESEEHKEGEDDSENTYSDHVGGSPHDASELDNEAVSASDTKQLDEDKEESGGEESEEADDTDSQPAAASDKPDKKTSDAELSDDELLVLNFIHIHFYSSCKVIRFEWF